MRILITGFLLISSMSQSCPNRFYFGDDSTKNILTEADSAKIKYNFCATASASYISYHNWMGDDRTAISFLSNCDFRHRKSYTTGWSHDHLIKAELGFLRYNDSIWLKSADQFKVALQWTEKPGKFLSHSYAFFIQSQVLRSWQVKYNEQKQQQVRELKGWFMAPGLIEMAYGLNWNFWERSRVNIAFATCRLSSKPRLNDNLNPSVEQDESLFKSKRRYIKTEYGFSAQLYINKDLVNKVLFWDCQSRFFFNALSRKGVHADISNRFTLRFLKYIQFRVDTHLLYEPAQDRMISYRQELLFGLIYDLRQ